MRKAIIMHEQQLPRWDLTELYHNHLDPKIQQDLSDIEQSIKQFCEDYQGRLKSLQAAQIADAIKTCEQQFAERFGAIMTYASLLHAQKLDDKEISSFYQGLAERISQLSAQTVFFTLEINQIDDEIIENWFNDPEVAHYRPWFRSVRKFKPYQLDEKVEQVLIEKNNTSTAAWVRLYDETFAAYRFEMIEDGKAQTKTITEVLNALMSPNAQVRKEAATALSKGLQDNEELSLRIINTIMADKAMEDRWRGFERPISSMNLDNDVEDDVVDALTKAVRAAYPRLSHRYYAYKAQKFGVKKLNYWDRNAPYPQTKERKWQFDDAKSLILSAYNEFSPVVGSLAQRFFDEGWIDAPASEGKHSGAFAHPSVPSHHPYILLNWFGKERDVMTLAHELGHGVHQLLAAKQGALMSGTPLTLAETASVFGEMLTFRKILDHAQNKEEKIRILRSKIEDMLNTVVRQIAFHQFETKIHDARSQGELTMEQIQKLWMEVQHESLGDAIALDENYHSWWSYISHFFHVPFYVYAYAFGDCLVNSLYQNYLDAPDGFAEKYIDLLKAGGTLHHKDALAPFGLDAADPDFWSKGLRMIENLIDELEQLDT